MGHEVMAGVLPVPRERFFRRRVGREGDGEYARRV